jgi:hypothetical protein
MGMGMDTDMGMDIPEYPGTKGVADNRDYKASAKQV